MHNKSINLDVHVYKSWGRGDHRLIVFKDSNDMFSLLETNCTETVNKLTCGECFELRNMDISAKVTPNE